MKNSNSFEDCFFLITFLMLCLAAKSQLSTNFYANSCPRLNTIVFQEVKKAVVAEMRMAASLLRLHFHDCFALGCDASNLLDGPNSEKLAAANLKSARGFDVIDHIKTAVEKACPGVVSCADIIALAARYSILFSGGPSYKPEMGRKDGPKAGLAEANAGIPTPNSTLHEIIGKFQAVGLSISQMVALSGGHTIGRARCESFADRLSNFKGTGAPDPTMDPNMLSELQKKCPQGTVTDDNNVTLVPLDRNSIDLFDNNYFKNLINSKGLLGSDQSLFSNISGSDAAQLTNDLVISFSNNAGIFTTSFVDAIIKMGQINVHTGADNGEIRKNCRSPNSLGVAS